MRPPPSAVRGRGQAMTEYVVIVLLVVIVLVASGGSPVEALLEAIKRAYNAFSYVISFSV